MEQLVPAVYESGVFRPLAPLELPEGASVVLRIEPETTTKRLFQDVSLEDQRAAIEAILRVADTLPLEGPDDGFSGADHDSVLYGRP